MSADMLIAHRRVACRAPARRAVTQPDPHAFLDEQQTALLENAAEIQGLIARA